jgi:hypothetical protein
MILKLNDLQRALDVSLNTTHGPVSPVNSEGDVMLSLTFERLPARSSRESLSLLPGSVPLLRGKMIGRNWPSVYAWRVSLPI